MYNKFIYELAIVQFKFGSRIEKELKQSYIYEAFCVILCNDLEIRNKERFKVKQVLQIGVSK